jgi:hypothetical protein
LIITSNLRNDGVAFPIGSAFVRDSNLTKGNHQLYQSNLLIFRRSRLNMAAPAEVSGARQVGKRGGMEPS